LRSGILSRDAISRFRLTAAPVQVFIIAAVALPYFVNLGTSSLWDANESFYAETPREMLESGDYLAPRFNYQPRAQKPPLTYWLILLSYQLLGVSEFAVRLPGALAALGALLFTYGIGRMLFSATTGILATIILGTCARFFVLARKLPIDIILIFWLTGAFFFLLRALRRNPPSLASWLWVYAFFALGFLTKGPIALIIPGATYLLWSLWAGRFSPRETRPLAGTLVFAAIVLPWYILIYMTHGWTYIASFFLRDNLGRFAAISFGPARGPFYYIPAYAFDFFPWSILSAVVGWYLWRSRKHLRQAYALCYGFPLFWCAVAFVLFSLSKNKQEYYIAPIYPMMAVLIAGLIERSLLARDSAEKTRLFYPWTWAFFIAAVGIFGISVFLLVLLRAMLPDSPIALHYLPTAILLPSSLLLAWQVLRGKLHRCFAGLAAPIWAMLVLASFVYLPSIEPYRPVREMCKLIEEQSRPGDEVGYFVATVPSMVYYLRRPVFEEFDPDAMVRRFTSSKSIFCVVTENDYNYFVGTRDLILYVLDRRPRLITQFRFLLDDELWAGNELLLVSNRPLNEKESRESP
jgi:4-amino-4-deoxy-L-arabinose transferase-like glycosyltransferase